jgi:hypothetical protein
MYEIEKGLGRIGLHDSHLSQIATDDGNLIIDVDWGYLKNFDEGNVSEPIVFDEAKLILRAINSQSFKKLTDNETIPTLRPIDFETDIWLVLTNEYLFIDDYHAFIFTLTNDTNYLEWTVNFKEGRLKWNKYILYQNWLTGKETL